MSRWRPSPPSSGCGNRRPEVMAVTMGSRDVLTVDHRGSRGRASVTTASPLRWRGSLTQRGSAMVELIVVLPILIFLLFALVELSRAWFMLQIATAAAGEGARAGAVAALGSEVSDGEARIDALLTTAGVNATSRNVTKRVLAGTPDFEVAATVNLTFTSQFPGLPTRLQTINMSETASMRYECNPVVRPCSPPP